MAIDTKNITPEFVATQKANFDKLHESTDKNHPIAQQIERLHTHAKAHFDTIQLAFARPDGYTIAEDGINKVKDLYDKAVELNLKMLPDQMQAALKPGNQSVDTMLDNEIDSIPDENGGKALKNKIQNVMNGFVELPSEVTDSSFFFHKMKEGSAGLRVDFNKVEETKTLIRYLQTIKGKAANSASIDRIIATLEAGIGVIEGIDPVRSKYHDHQIRINRGNAMDTRPLRIAVGLVGGLFATLGIGYSLATGNKMTWPTFMWAAAAAYALCPRLFDGADKNFVQKIATTITPNMIALKEEKDLPIGMGEKMLETLQDADSDTKKLIAVAAKSDTPQPAQIYEIFQRDKDMTDAFLKLPKDIQKATLSEFGTSKMSAASKGIITDFFELN